MSQRCRNKNDHKQLASLRIFSLILALLLASNGMMFPPNVQAAVTFAGGNGTKANPYRISTAEQLNEVRNYHSSHFLLVDHIDLSIYANWTPIDGFSGTLDGMNHTISHLTVNTSTSDAGLFSQLMVEGVEIKNLIIEDVEISGRSNGSSGVLAGYANTGIYEDIVVSNGSVSAGRHVGGLLGYARGHVEVRNSSTNVAVTGTEHVGGLIGRNYSTTADRLLVENSAAHGPVAGNGKYVGGLLGSLNLGDVRQSIATGTVRNTGDHTGGLVGIAENSSTIEHSISEGDVNSNKSNTGGLVGYMKGTASIKQSHAKGNVTSSGNDTGGLVGEMDGSTSVLDSTASGNVSSPRNVGGLIGWIFNGGQVSGSSASGQVDGGSNAGGLVGFSSSNPNIRIEHSFATGHVTGDSAIGGLVGNLERGTIENAYATGNVTSKATGTGQNGAGGIAGLANSTSSITDVYYEGIVRCASYCGGIVGHSNGIFTLNGAYALGEVVIDGPSNPLTASAAGIIGYAATPSGTSYKVSNVYALQTRIDGSPIFDYSIGRVMGNNSSANGTLSNLRGNPDMDVLYMDHVSYELPAPGFTSFTGQDVDVEVTIAETLGTFESVQDAYPSVNAIPYGPLKDQLLERLERIEIFELRMPDPVGLLIVGQDLHITPQIRKQGLHSMEVTVTLDTYSVSKTLDNPYPLLDWTEVPLTWDMSGEAVPDGNFSTTDIEVKSLDSGHEWAYTWNQPVRLDRTGPDVLVTVLDEDGEPYTTAPSAKPLTISASATDAMSAFTFEVQLDDEGWNVYIEPIKLDRDGAYSVEFRATDEAGNITTVKRTVVLSQTGPTLVLHGDVALRWPVGKPFMEPGYEAYSNYFGDLTDDVIVDLDGLNIASPAVGTYEVVYTVTDGVSLTAEATRIVEVFDDFAKPNVAFPGAFDQLIGVGGTIRLPISVWTEGWEELKVSAELFGVTRQVKLIPPAHAPGVPNVELVWSAAELPAEGATDGIPITITGTHAGTHTYLYDYRLAVNQVAPVITVLAELADGSEYSWGDVSQAAVSVSAAADGGLAEPNPVEYRIDGGAWQEYGETLLFEATGRYELEFRTTDTMGNESTWGPGTIVVNNENPMITLLGSQTIEFPIDEVYHEPGFMAQSSLYGDLTSAVTVTGAVYDGMTLSEKGQFEIYYDVTDPSGRSALTKTRIIRVYNHGDVTNLTLEPTGARVQIGQTANFKLIAQLADQSTRDVTDDAVWTVAEPGIASIDSPGVLTGLKQGVTFVTATYGGLSVQGQVTVNRKTEPAPNPTPGYIPGGGWTGDQASRSGIRFFVDGDEVQRNWKLHDELDTKDILIVSTSSVGDEYKLEIDVEQLADLMQSDHRVHVILETPLVVYEFDMRDATTSWNEHDKLQLIMTKATDEMNNEWHDWLSKHGASEAGEMLGFELQWVNDSGAAVPVTNMRTPIIRRIALSPGETNVVATAYDPSTGEARAVPTMMEMRDGISYLTFIRFGNSFYAPIRMEGPTFQDVIGHWADGDIHLLAERGIVHGVSATRFEPDREITRAEFAALLVRGFGLMLGSPESATRFTDLKADGWYSADVAGAMEAGLLLGYDDDTFRPGRTISREEAAVMLDRLLTMLPLQSGEGETPRFADADRISSYAREAVQRLTFLGFLYGRDDNRFAPQDELSRAEATALIQRIWSALGWI